MSNNQTEKADLYRVGLLDNLLVFKATYRRFQFSRHIHEDFALGIMEEGTQKFHCGGEVHYAQRGNLITVNPGEVHDGMSADGEDYKYKIIYIPEGLMQKIGQETTGKTSYHQFGAPVLSNCIFSEKLFHIFQLLSSPEPDLLEVQSYFYLFLADLLQFHGRDQSTGRMRFKSDAVERACEFINDMARKDIDLDDIAEAAGLSRFHFLRVFSASQNMTPHAYLVQRRLLLAKEAICRGESLADAAFYALFADQSHFTRKFKAAYGITPRQYQKAVS